MESLPETVAPPETSAAPKKPRRKPQRRLRVWHKRIAQLYIQGYTLEQIARTVGGARDQKHPSTRQYIWKVLQDPLMQDYIATLQSSVEEKLEVLEHEAAARASELLDAPDLEIQYKMVVDALNRAGKRGKPVERSISATPTFTLPPEEALANMLADPGVRAQLAANPDLRAKLLPPGEPDAPAAP